METDKLIKEIDPQSFGLEVSKAQEMTSGLNVTLGERKILEDAYLDVIDLEITEENLPTFKELRLKIVKNRTQGIEKWHTTNKAFYLAGGRFVDAIKNKEVAINEAMEKKLMDAEKYFENLEKERLEKLKQERIGLVSPYTYNTDGIDFSLMNQEVFESYLSSLKTKYEAKIEAEKKAEEERIAKEKVEAEAREQQRLENERLKKEAEKREKEIEAERKKQADLLAKQKAESDRLAKIEADKQAKLKAEQDAILKKEREEKARLEAELQAKKEAEIKAENDRKLAEENAKKEAEKLAKAPIKKQLNNWVNEFEIPKSNIEHYKKAIIEEKFNAFKKWAINEIESL